VLQWWADSQQGDLYTRFKQMTVAHVVTAKEQQFLKRAAKAVRDNDLPALRREVVIYTEMLGRDTIETLLDEQLPLVLELEYIPCLLQMMLDGEDYHDTVRDMLAEMTKVLSSEGLMPGTDFSYGEDPSGLPQLILTSKAFDQARDVYNPSAWKQCLPYLRVGN
jgi:hypothetical protein